MTQKTPTRIVAATGTAPVAALRLIQELEALRYGHSLGGEFLIRAPRRTKVYAR